MKTMFAIYLMEDEEGFVRVRADHYGPGEASYFLGMEMLPSLNKDQRDFLHAFILKLVDAVLFRVVRKKDAL